MRAASTDLPLAGFWMGGFEGADHVNGRGQALDLNQLGGHWQQLDADHRRAAAMGIRCVRESIGWRISENGAGVIELTRAERVAESAQRHGLQVLWTLMHYGLPEGLSLHDDRFIERLARFGALVARVIGRSSATAPVFTPVNEISFLSWAAAQPGMLHPPNHTPETDDATRCARGYAVKRRLVQATLATMDAMRAVDPRCRFLHVEPLIHVAPPNDRPELQADADALAHWQWQAWDLLGGRCEPALGGHPQALDLLGINHYHHSQWELHSGHRLSWEGRDHRRRPLSHLLQDVWARYQRPVLVAETSHVGCGREAWLHETAAELRVALQAGVPLLGACLYPLLDRPDWDNTTHWHRSGLWHVDEHHPEQPRLPEPGYARALQAWQRVLPHAEQPPARKRPLLLVFSHMRWDFVAHRTRYLMEHLAAHWQVVLVEEPVSDGGPPRLHTQARGPCIDVLVPHLGAAHLHAAPGFARDNTSLLHVLLQAWLLQHGHTPAVAWLTTPMALDLARSLAPGALVYDCNDELAGFLGAPPELPRLESELLRCADRVFAASSALARTRADASGREVHHLPNGVDIERFQPRTDLARDWAAFEAQALQGHVPQPRIGYAGVIDERLDTGLLASLAQARPHWQFVMLGPVMKIAPASLPQAPNIHWLGEQPAAAVPAFMTGWSLGLIPFVERSVTTRSHPLKALEYLAAGLPVVATPIADLSPLLDAGLVMAPDLAGFLHACDNALAETPGHRAQRQARARERLAPASWHASAQRVQACLVAMGQPLQPQSAGALLSD
jgi:glycosyltransferase involved in cell wall biosynthesis/beta-glucosidase/6-phospho-beta-glucosidase/beta-galactosidase